MSHYCEKALEMLNDPDRIAFDIERKINEITILGSLMEQNPYLAKSSLCELAAETSEDHDKDYFHRLCKRFDGILWKGTLMMFGGKKIRNYELTERWHDIWLKQAESNNTQDIMILGMTMEENSGLPACAIGEFAESKSKSYGFHKSKIYFDKLARELNGLLWKREKGSYYLKPKWAHVCLESIEQYSKGDMA